MFLTTLSTRTTGSMNTSTRYHLIIDEAISALVESSRNQEQFDESIVQLQAIVPTYGITLRHMNILLNEITDPESSFRVSMKNKMISLLVPRELIDFGTTMKIISVFKVSSYYTQKAKIKILPTTLQSKLAHILTKNLVAIKWETDCLCFGNILFDLLSIGYLRSDIAVFLLYFLNISKQISPTYNLKFFFNIKKIESLLEFYEMDRKSILPLLIFAHWYLETIQRTNEFEALHFKLKKTIQNAKFTKDVFGKLDTQYVSKLLAMERSSIEMMMLEDNIQLIVRIMTNLNSNFVNFSIPVTRKRKFLEEDQNTIESPELYGIYSTDEVSRLVKSAKGNYNILTILKYFSETDLKSYTPVEVNDIKINGIDLNFCAFNPPVFYISEYNMELLNYQVLQIINIKDNVLLLSSDMQWIFKAMSNISRFTGLIFQLMDDILSQSISIKYEGSDVDIFKILYLSESLCYIRPNFGKYQVMLKRCIYHTFTFNDTEMMKGLTRLVYNWRSSNVDYKQLLNLIIGKFQMKNKALLLNLLQIYNSTHTIPSDMLPRNIILAPHIIVACLIEQNLHKIDLLLQHLSFCYRINVGEVFKKINLGYINDVFGILFDYRSTELGIISNLMKINFTDESYKLKRYIDADGLTNDELSLKLKELSYLGIHEFYEVFKNE